MTSHFPVLQVVLPLIAAPLALLLRQRHLAYVLLLVVSAACLFISLSLWFSVQDGSVISYAMGSWPPPWGIEYRIDQLNAFVLVLVSATALLTVIFSLHSIEIELPARMHYLFYTMFALCLAGLLGITATADAFNIFVFLEVSSLSTYTLIAMGRQRKALFAAYRYLIMGTIGATLIVMGIGILYLLTGTLNLNDMATRLDATQDTRPAQMALAFISVGIFLKLALFPLHHWLPNAYAYAPSAVSAFLAATATKVAIYVLLRFYFTVFGQDSFTQLPLRPLIIVLALSGMFVASFVAIYQTDLKRLFAFSSVAQVGYIMLGLAIGNEAGLLSAVLHLFNHGIAKGAVFMLLGIVAYAIGSTQLSHLKGLGKTMPLTSAGIVIAGLALIGVPGTNGFISKWYLLLAAINDGQWWLAFLIVSSSLLAIAYVWRFVEIAYLQPPDADAHLIRKLPFTLVLPAAVLVVATIYFGIDTRFTVGAATGAVELMLGAPQ
jgi:multicomponent Na+:H+ antiporter subunit D